LNIPKISASGKIYLSIYYLLVISTVIEFGLTFRINLF
jgi:hypothetical protein